MIHIVIIAKKRNMKSRTPAPPREHNPAPLRERNPAPPRGHNQALPHERNQALPHESALSELARRKGSSRLEHLAKIASARKAALLGNAFHSVRRGAKEDLRLIYANAQKILHRACFKHSRKAAATFPLANVGSRGDV